MASTKRATPVLSKSASEDHESEVMFEGNDANESSDVYTLDQALDRIGVGRAQIKLIVICGFWWAADAMEVMLLSFLLPTLEKEWKLKSWQSALIAASTFTGILIGSFAWGVLADKLGRRKAYLATALFTSAFGLISCFAQGFVGMMVLRGLLGFGIGGSPIAFSMLTEFLPKNNRGVFLIFFEAFWTGGTVLEVFLAWIVLPTLGWRWLLGLSSIPLWCLLLCYPILPESPRYLLISGDYDGAVQVIQATALQNGASLPEGAILDRDFKDDSRGNILELLSPSVRRLSILLWILWVAHAVIYYGNVLFTPKFYGTHSDSGGSTPSSPMTYPPTTTTTPPMDTSSSAPRTSPSWLNLYVFVLLTTIAELPGLLGAAILVEKIGRRKTMAVMLGLCVAMLLLLMFKVPGWLGAILLSLSRMGINGSIATLWTYTPESYPTTLRATGMGVANSLAKLATTGTPFISTALPDKYLWVALLIFIMCCIGGIAAAMLLPFDTKDSVLPSTINALRSMRSPSHGMKDLSAFGELSGESGVDMSDFGLHDDEAEEVSH